MSEYIERNDAFEIVIRTCGDYAAAFSEIRKLKAADVAPVVHGQWLIVKGSNGKEYHACSHCGHEQEVTGVKNFCAVCGARMDGEADG